MAMTIKESMLEFLKTLEGEPFHVLPRVEMVYMVKLKIVDDEFGAIGEHYYVKCKMLKKTLAYSEENTITEGKPYDAYCLVDAKGFNKFRSTKHTVIWQ